LRDPALDALLAARQRLDVRDRETIVRMADALART
jgi:hypothetical protein